MLLSAAIIFFELTIGVFLLDFFDPEGKFSSLERLASGIFLGFFVSNFVVLIFALILGSLTLGIISFLFLSLIITALYFRRIYSYLQNFFRSAAAFQWFTVNNSWIFFLLAILVSYYIFIGRVLFEDASGNLKSYLPGWGDNAFHLDLIQRFSASQPFILLHPTLGGVNLSYPFMSDFASAVFKKIGGGIVFSYRFPLTVFGLTFLVLTFCFSRKFLKSKNLAILALVMVIFGSGLGFTVFFKDLQRAFVDHGREGLVTFIKSAPHEYTHLDSATGGKEAEKDSNENIVWIVPIVSFLSHQKGFSMGLAGFAFILLGLFYYGGSRAFWRFSLIAGLTPFWHGHSFLALAIFLAVVVWFYIPNFKSWLKFGLLASVIALPQILYFSAGRKTEIKLWFGWMACEGRSNHWFFCGNFLETIGMAFVFWVKNFGIIFILWAVVLFMVSACLFSSAWKNKMRVYFNFGFIAASFVLFVLPNFILFQPWSFDNNKILFFWWMVAIISCVVPALGFLWRRNLLVKSFATILVILSILAGAVDFSSRLFIDRNKGYYGYADVSDFNRKIARWIEVNTSPNSLFLTNPSVDPVPLFLAGRPVYYGYEGWLWSHGSDYNKNKINSESILSGDLKKACQENVEYIYLNRELKDAYSSLNESKLRSGAKNVFHAEEGDNSVDILKVVCD